MNTAILSNHPGHGGCTGRVASAGEIADLIDGIAAHGGFDACAAVLSGYLGDASIGPVVLDAVQRLRAASPPRGLYACDPVIGDAGRAYVRPGIADFLAQRAVPAADILTPNMFELGVLSGGEPANEAEILAAAARLRGRMRQAGPRIVLVSGVISAETPAGAMDVYVIGPQGAAICRTPRLDRHFSGAGDALAAVFLFHFLNGRPAPDAMARAVSSVHAVLTVTQAAGAVEMQIVQAQSAWCDPPVAFAARGCAA